MENYNTIELTVEEQQNVEGGWVIAVLGGIGLVFGAAYAIGYTAHYVYDQFND